MWDRSRRKDRKLWQANRGSPVADSSPCPEEPNLAPSTHQAQKAQPLPAQRNAVPELFSLEAPGICLQTFWELRKQVSGEYAHIRSGESKGGSPNQEKLASSPKSIN